MDRAAANPDNLYSAHSESLRRFMLKLTGNTEDAADLVQEIFLRLIQQDSMPEYPKAWLSRTGYRLFVDHWRRKQRCVWVPLEDGLPSQGTPEQNVLEEEFEKQFRLLLLRLHPRTRKAFHLRIFEQLSYGEIAVKLGCPENTVKTCLRRGKAQLSKWL